MSLAIVLSRAQVGVEAPAVTVETHLANGLPALTLVGLPEGAVRESKDRVRSAILNCRLDFPARRITLNLAPADLPKDGGRFDLAIALGLLAASAQIPTAALEGIECLGELALSGAIRPVQGLGGLARHNLSKSSGIAQDLAYISSGQRIYVVIMRGCALKIRLCTVSVFAPIGQSQDCEEPTPAQHRATSQVIGASIYTNSISAAAEPAS